MTEYETDYLDGKRIVRPKPIERFTGIYAPFSAYWRGGILLPTLEHHFHMCKTYDRNEQLKVMRASSPARAKQRGRELDLRPEWDAERVRVMFALNVIKFTQPELKELLVSTGKAQLIHGNHHGDTFWGQVDRWGFNMLGRILMKIRSQVS